jgi:hypothetical protein
MQTQQTAFTGGVLIGLMSLAAALAALLHWILELGLRRAF